jgi:glycosyltransferase involved in cell wall biosynthesis
MKAAHEGRVLQVIEATVGGTKRHVLDLVTGLRAGGWDVEVACPRIRESSYGDTSLCDELRAARVPVHEIPMRRASVCWTNVAAILRVRDLIAQGRYAVLHAHSSIGGAIARTAARLTRRPPAVVYTPNGWAFLLPGSRLRRAAYLALERGLGTATDRLIAVSPSEAAEARRHRIAGPRVVTIPNGIDAPAPRPVERSAVIRCPAVIGTVARLTPQKDPFTWLAVVSEVRRRRPDTWFVWIGGGELEHAVAAAAERVGVADAIRILPYREDARDALQTFDVFLLTSVFEGLPYALLEALAAGLPVVATSVVGIRDVVRHAETGFLAPAGDPAALAAAVVRLLDDPDLARRIGEAGRRDVVERFSVRAMVEQTAQLYAELIEA